jgi:DNA-binding MurR/RpiR family transcriptional regulator
MYVSHRTNTPISSEKNKIDSSINTPDDLIEQVREKYETLSKQLKIVADYIQANRDRVALQKIQEIAEACTIQPSTIVRFAKQFGFSGYSEMQEIFKEAFTENLHSKRSKGYDYRKRSRMNLLMSQDKDHDLVDIGYNIIEANRTSIDKYLHEFNTESYLQAIELLAEKDVIYLSGVRRMYGIIQYLAYNLRQAGKLVVILDGAGGNLDYQVNSIRPKDVLFVISVSPYGEETLDSIQKAVENGCPVIGVTDNIFSPVVQESKVYFQVNESNVGSFRTLSAMNALIHAIGIGVSCYLEKKIKQDDEIEII